MTPHAKKIEDAINEAMDLMAATLGQPADVRAWAHLLIYCPDEVIAARVARIRDMVLVPREPTRAMVFAGASSLDHPSVFMGGPSHGNRRKADSAYRAMIAAARGEE